MLLSFATRTLRMSLLSKIEAKFGSFQQIGERYAKYLSKFFKFSCILLPRRRYADREVKRLIVKKHSGKT